MGRLSEKIVCTNDSKSFVHLIAIVKLLASAFGNAENISDLSVQKIEIF